MKKLVGLNEYLSQNYEKSFFDKAKESGKFYDFHIHGHQILTAKVTENQPYQVQLAIKNGEKIFKPKIEIKFIHEHAHRDKVLNLISYNDHVKKQQFQPIINQRNRHHVKNKSLYPLMKDREVLFFTMLEGEILRGVIADFSRYEITVNLKGGIPVVLLRHALYDLRDKKRRCYLKSVQQKAKDWQKSSYFKEIK